MTRPSDDRFRTAFNTIEKHIETKYGIPVRISDVADPFTGDLSGSEIMVDYDQEVEDALFIIAHLFGHTVQWALSERARTIGADVQSNPTAEMLDELEDYERQACRMSLTLFHECGIHDLDQWLSDFAACDFLYLRNFYATGEKVPFRTFWVDGKPLLEPMAIPAFQPAQWRTRWSGVVV